MVGVALQLAVGDFEASWLRYPWSAIVAINYLYLLVLCYAMEDKWPWAKGLRSVQSSVVALTSMVIMTVIFGLTRQDGSTEGMWGALGFSRMTSSWPFNLLLLNLLTSLGLSAIDDWRCVKSRRIATLLSHTAVFVALAAAMFGSGDKLRLRVSLPLDMDIYEATTEQGRLYELPFAMRLREFNVEEYPPQLHIYNLSREQLSDESFSVDDGVGTVGEWSLRVEEYLPMAGRLPEETEYRAMQHVGATHAVFVVAENRAKGLRIEGWVSCGSHIFAPASLDLGGGEFVVMPEPKAKSYLSRIAVESGDEVKNFDVRVNHPARIGAWSIYQVGYDTERGRWSTTSTVECVRDGWWPIVSVALWLILASAVVMFFGKMHSNRARKL